MNFLPLAFPFSSSSASPFFFVFFFFFFFFDFWFSLSPLLICAFLVHTIPSLSLRCVDSFVVVSRWAGGRVVDDAMLSIPRPPSLLSFRFGFF